MQIWYQPFSMQQCAVCTSADFFFFGNRCISRIWEDRYSIIWISLNRVKPRTLNFHLVTIPVVTTMASRPCAQVAVVACRLLLSCSSSYTKPLSPFPAPSWSNRIRRGFGVLEFLPFLSSSWSCHVSSSLSTRMTTTNLISIWNFQHHPSK